MELENILGIETKFVNPLKDFPVIESFADIERAANQVRSEWKIGTDAIVNVVELLEENHIKVIYLEAGNAYDGMQSWVLNHDIPVIAINQNVVKKDDRKRFTAMHELAHLLLPLPDNITEKEKEKYCHQFAGAFLLPGDALKKELGDKRSRIVPCIINQLNRSFREPYDSNACISCIIKLWQVGWHSPPDHNHGQS